MPEDHDFHEKTLEKGRQHHKKPYQIMTNFGGIPPNQIILVGGIPTPLKNMKVSWDDDIPNSMEKYNMFQTTNQNKPWFSSIPLLAPDLVVSIDIDHLEIPMQK